MTLLVDTPLTSLRPAAPRPVQVRGAAMFACLAILLLATPARAADIDLARLQDEAVERLQEYLRVDTVNPPGNESRGVDYFGRILAAAGIPYETAESAPGRGNLWARLEGGPEPALILLHHMDVVPADPKYWTTAPLGGEIRDGYVYGRGAIDTKSLGIFGLQAFLGLHRAGRPLRRPVVFVATADEEAGGEFGAGWLVKNRPEIFRDAGLLLNEGGSGLQSGDRQILSVEVAQKIPLWLRLVARDHPSHGSMPHAQSSVTRLVRALDAIARNPFEPRVIPAVDQYAKARAAAGFGREPQHLANLAAAIRDPGFLQRLRADEPGFAALLQDTCAITRLQGSNKINVVPPEASAELDCRLLPDQDPDRFLAQLRGFIDDDGIEVVKLMTWGPSASPTDSELFAAIESVAKRHHPGAVLAPSVVAGFTDSHYFREIGITSYGYSPVMLPVEELMRVHGNDERLSIENVRRGTRMMLELVAELVYAPAASDEP